MPVAMAAVGLVLGCVVVGLTLLTSAYGPTSPDGGWSLRGNGALAVPFVLGPALLVTAWTGLVLRWRGHRRALPVALGAGAVELVLAALTFVVPAWLFVAWLILVLAWLMGSPALVSRLPVAAGPRSSFVRTLAGMAALTAGLVLSLVLGVVAGSAVG